MRAFLTLFVALLCLAGCERPKTTGNNAFKEYVSVPKQKARDVKGTLEGAQDRAAEEAQSAMRDD